MKKVQIIIKNAIIKIRDTAVTSVDFIKDSSTKQKVIIGTSAASSILLIICGITIFNLHNSKTNEDKVIVLSQDSTNNPSTVTSSQSATTTVAEEVASPSSIDTSTITTTSTANPAITDSKPAPTAEGQSQPTAQQSQSQSTPKQSQPTPAPAQAQPASTPNRMSGAEMTNYVKATSFNHNTNNDNTGSQLQICTPEFLSSAMSIIDSFINGSLDSGTAKSRLQALNGTGQHPNQYGVNEVTVVNSVNVVDCSVPGSTSKDGVSLKASNLQGSGVTDLLVTYDSSNDTYRIRGIKVVTGISGV